MTGAGLKAAFQTCRSFGVLCPQFDANNTACWRGYVGTWEITEDRLYLVGLRAWLPSGEELKLADMLAGQPAPVFANWFSGTVRCPQGKLLQYVHGGFESRYESDLFLTFDKGVLMDERVTVKGMFHRIDDAI